MPNTASISPGALPCERGSATRAFTALNSSRSEAPSAVGMDAHPSRIGQEISMARRIHGVDVGILPKATDREGAQLRFRQ